MNARSRFLNQAVSATITAAAVAPTISVRTMTSACSRRRARRMSERLSDSEMHAPAPGLWRAVDEQPGDRIELVAKVESNRTDRCLIPQSRTDGIAQIVQPDSPGASPHVPRIKEQDPAEIAVQRRAQLRAERQRAVAANRQAG